MVPGPPSGEGWAESEEWIPRARRLGPLRYSDLGRRALDPVPADAVDALAAWVASEADAWWETAGHPDPYTLVVVSGDDGPLAAAVLEAEPKCAAALRYVVVNPDAAGRAEPPPSLVRLVALEDPMFLYPSGRAPGMPAGADPDGSGAPAGADPAAAAAESFEEGELDDLDERPPARGIGPLATFLTDVPALGESEGAVVVIEMLSRLPFDLYEYEDEPGQGSWREVRVAADGDDLQEMTLLLGDEVAGLPDPPPTAGGLRWRRQIGASDWLRRVLPSASASAARLVVVDRWSEPSGVELDQLRQVREPLDPDPVQIAGTPFAAVTWPLGDRAKRA